MTQELAHALSLDVPCDRQAAVTVRQALRETDGIGGSLWAALLVGSELVTNAVLHSGCAANHILEVRADLRRDRLFISVHDPGVSGHLAQPRQAGSGLGGWGLRIVEQLAERWGSERPDGYRVWAELKVRT
jgi:anti-sigma regulatory factor (Ser/Thr protein kinase)